MWVLLEHYNEYDQKGGYFAGVFHTPEDAAASVSHIGRKDCENSWYELKEYTIGMVYSEEDRDID